VHCFQIINNNSALHNARLLPNYIGFFINVGTRDETEETSGSLLALKNTYLKTLKHTNETINYGMI